MKNLLLAVSFVMIVFMAHSQDNPYLYSVDAESKTIKLDSKDSHIRYGYKLESNKEGKVASVKINGSAFRLIRKRTDNGRVKVLVDSSGTVRGSVSVNGKKLFLPDGRVLRTTGISHKQWSFLDGNTEMIRGYEMEMDGKTYVQIIKFDPNLADPAVMKFLALDIAVAKNGPPGPAFYICMALLTASAQLLGEAAR